MTEGNQGGLSAAEEAYFASGGETEVTDTPEVVTDDTQQADAPVIDADQPVAEDPPQDATRDEKGRFVPHQALHAEREEHKKTKAQVEELAKFKAVMEDRWSTLLKMREPDQQQVEQEQAPPDPNEDIFAYAKWQGDKLKSLEEKLTSRETQETQQRQVVQQEQEIWNHWSQSAQSYAAEKPDFGDAVKYLSEARSKQLGALAAVDPRFGEERGRTEQINAELRQIVASARERNLNPAEVVYQIAQTYGFAGTQPTPQGGSELAEKLSQIDAAQNASRTLTASSGKSGADPLSPEAIASMPQPEFEAWLKNPDNEKRFRKMMGA